MRGIKAAERTIEGKKESAVELHFELLGFYRCFFLNKKKKKKTEILIRIDPLWHSVYTFETLNYSQDGNRRELEYQKSEWCLM